ncbi:MAG: hypothetical protein ACD_66C00263G0001, partial [uncultured bacterium]
APTTIDWEKLIAEARTHNGGDESRTWDLVTTMLSMGGKPESRDALVRLETLVADSVNGKRLKNPVQIRARILAALSLYNDALGDLTHAEIQERLTRTVKTAVGEVDHANYERKVTAQRDREVDAMRTKLAEEAARRAAP